MPPEKPTVLWWERFRQWLNRQVERLSRRPAPAPAAPPPAPGPEASAGGAYPDYVTCPHCGEPEVEVWSGETSARCHNCGNTFDVPRQGT